MANLALPFMAIAGAYLLSNKNNNEDEEEDNECAFIDNTQKPAAPNIIQQFKNIPKPLNNMNLEVETVNNNEILLLNGDTANINDFQHNNAVPFFGGSIKGPTLDRDHDHILDHKVGGGSLHNQKKSQAPLFQPITTKAPFLPKPAQQSEPQRTIQNLDSLGRSRLLRFA